MTFLGFILITVFIMVIIFWTFIFKDAKKKRIILTRYTTFRKILDDYNKNKSFKFMVGPLGAFLSVEMKFQEYLDMNHDMRVEALKLRKNRSLYVISQAVPPIIVKNINMIKVINTNKNKPDDPKETQETEGAAPVNKKDANVNKFIIGKLRPKPYEAPLTKIKKKKKSSYFNSFGNFIRSKTGHMKVGLNECFDSGKVMHGIENLQDVKFPPSGRKPKNYKDHLEEELEPSVDDFYEQSRHLHPSHSEIIDNCEVEVSIRSKQFETELKKDTRKTARRTAREEGGPTGRDVQTGAQSEDVVVSDAQMSEKVAGDLRGHRDVLETEAAALNE